MWLDKNQLNLVDEYLERREFNFDEDFEFYNDLRIFAIKCFNVLKFQKNTRLGLTICAGKVVDLLIDDKHDFCYCSRVPFNTKLKEI